MQLLEYYHHQKVKNVFFIPRKSLLPTTSALNLYGVRGAGKSSLAIDTLLEVEKEKALYIDCQDPNFTLSPLLLSSLQHYIEVHSITHLVLDHYQEGLLPSFPQVRHLIVVTRIPLDNTSLEPFELFPLDYEEFLAFEGGNISTKGFNHFLRVGTLPLVAKTPKQTMTLFKLFFQSAFNPKEQEILLILAQQQTNHITIHQLYTFTKERFKISKDWLYRTIKEFEKEKILFFLPESYHKSGKKLILFDFAFPKYLSHRQSFSTQFDTMVALTLLKHHIPIKTLGKEGYITQEGELIMPAPFESEERLWLKAQNSFSLYKKFSIQKITIVTVANHYQFKIEKIHFEALPFTEWSILNDSDLHHTKSEV